MTICDKHDVCMLSYDNQLKNMEKKLESVCKRMDEQNQYGERITAIEHRLDGHQRDLNGNLKKWDKHENYAKEKINEQKERDEKMDDDIKSLSQNLASLPAIIAEMKTDIRNYVDEKIEALIGGWRKMVIGAMGVMILTCASAIGTLVILYIQSVSS